MYAYVCMRRVSKCICMYTSLVASSNAYADIRSIRANAYAYILEFATCMYAYVHMRRVSKCKCMYTSLVASSNAYADIRSIRANAYAYTLRKSKSKLQASAYSKFAPTPDTGIELNAPIPKPYTLNTTSQNSKP